MQLLTTEVVIRYIELPFFSESVSNVHTARHLSHFVLLRAVLVCSFMLAQKLLFEGPVQDRAAIEVVSHRCRWNAFQRLSRSHRGERGEIQVLDNSLLFVGSVE